MRAALINAQSSKIENVIEIPDDYDPAKEGAYLPPTGFKVEKDVNNKAIVGGTFKNGVWEPPPPVEPAPVVVNVQEQIDNLTALLISKGTITQTQATSLKTPKPSGPQT